MTPPPSRARRRRLALAAAAAVTPLVVTGFAVLQAPAQAEPSPLVKPAKLDNPSSRHRVTLVTGDVVTLTTLADGNQIADVDRPDDAVGGVRMQEIGDDVYVIPDEAVGLLGAGKLDRRLFNVTDLIEMGYDDASAGQVPTIATYAPAKARSAAPRETPEGSKVVRKLPSIHGAALVTKKPKARTFWEDVAPDADPTDPTPTLGAGIEKLWLDGRVKAALKESVPQVGAPEAWAAGYDGAGVKVAVLDTGIDVNHPDFAGQIDGTASFVPDEAVTDVNGHGTHVASTIVGSGAASGGDNKGVAPGADLIVGKVLGGEEGYGQDSWVLAGMEWAAQSGADVVSMSLGDTYQSDGSDPMSQAVDALSAQYDALFVIAAGNAGPESISSPGAATSALTVGAVDKQDNLAGFSSTGPLVRSGALKPDITAPGVDITAARSQEMTDGGSGLYRTISGTSMATPHVSGAAAILAQQHPAWTGEQLKEHLMSSAKGLADWYSPFEVGTGRLDVAAAVRNNVRSTGSVLLGNYTWPHEPSDGAVTKDVTFTNTGDTDVTLDLALAQTSTAFTLGAPSVTVPAGGTTTVPVTGDPTGLDFGRHTGYVVGTDAATGTQVTRTSLGMIKEDERYSLTVKLRDRNGEPAAGWVGFAMAGDFWPWSEYVDGEKTLRLPPGSFTLTSYLDVAGETADRSGLAMLVDPETILDQDREVVLDASQARLLQTAAPEPTEDRQRKVDFERVDSFGLQVRGAYAVNPTTDDLYVLPTEPVTEGSFIATTRWRKGEPLLGLSTSDGRTRFESIVQPGSALATAKKTVPTVYAGKGAAADYRGLKVRGKVAVVERSDEVSPADRAAAAAEAGAMALVVVNDGVGGLMEYVGETTIPVATVHRDAGQQLLALAKAGRMLTVDQDRYTDFVYDLTRDYPGQVPDSELVYKPTQAELARIDARYYSVKDQEGSGYRGDLTLTPTLGFHEREWHPGTRVEWVTPEQVWVESHAQNIHSDPWLPWDLVSGTNTYPAGKTTRLDWFKPAIRPAFSDSFAVRPSRAQNFMTWNSQQWGSSSKVLDLGGYLPWGETPTHTQVFQGDTLIHDNPWSGDMQWVEVPAGNLPYRVVTDAERPADTFRLSTRTHTEWTYMSGFVDSDYFEDFSVMQLDYDLETDLYGDIRAGKKHEIALRSVPSHSEAPLPGKVTEVTLDISYDDGTTWRKVTLTMGADGWWRGSFKAEKGSGEFLSLRASAEMDSNYSINQEIIRAYGLR